VEPLYILAEIAGKFNLNLTHLIDSLISAWMNQTACCGPLQITCRDVKDSNTAMFLITDNDQVVSQFPIKTQVLEDPARFKEYLQYIPIPEIREHYRRRVRTQFQKIKELHTKMKNVNLRAKITRIHPMKRVPTQYGEWANLATIQIEDDTGSINLSLWNAQQLAFDIGDTVEVLNGNVKEFRGELQLHLGRKGTISSYSLAS
jgi:hypothetical protein